MGGNYRLLYFISRKAREEWQSSTVKGAKVGACADALWVRPWVIVRNKVIPGADWRWVLSFEVEVYNKEVLLISFCQVSTLVFVFYTKKLNQSSLV